MTTEAARRKDVLDDSEATLRQVQGVLSELGAEDRSQEARVERVVSSLGDAPTGLEDLVRVLMTTYGEIMNVIDSLRRSRGLLEQAAMERLKTTHQKLAEVSSATEMAATGMLDGLDRALVLVDELETATEPEDSAPGDAPALRGELREELHSLISLLQFQDITAQQLGYAGGVLQDIEERMVQLSRIFDLRGLGVEGDGADPDHPAHAEAVASEQSVCDPEASFFAAGDRQAVADEIFK